MEPDLLVRPFQDVVSGFIVINTKSSMSHSGLVLQMSGKVNLQLSAKSVGLFEAFYNSLKPITILDYSVEIQKSGKLYPSSPISTYFFRFFYVLEFGD
jgi:hypothetical protein